MKRNEKREELVTIWSCDVCKKDLIPGMKTGQCEICDRDMCLSHYRDFQGMYTVCTICFALSEAPAESLNKAEAQFEKKKTAIFELWKLTSRNP